MGGGAGRLLQAPPPPPATPSLSPRLQLQWSDLSWGQKKKFFNFWFILTAVASLANIVSSASNLATQWGHLPNTTFQKVAYSSLQ